MNRDDLVFLLWVVVFPVVASIAICLTLWSLGVGR